MASAVPDYCEPILGWRGWNVVDGLAGPRLLSAFSTVWLPHEALVALHGYTIPWPAPEVQWQCPGVLCVPDNDNPGCGIYAYKAPEYLRLRATTIDGSVPPVILGQVALWGTVVEHATGYRATLAYPHRFVYAHHCDGQSIAQTYGIRYQEDPSWKSALRSDALPSSPFKVPSLNAVQQIASFPPMQVRLIQPFFPPNAPPSPPSPPVSEDQVGYWRAQAWQRMRKLFGI